MTVVVPQLVTSATCFGLVWPSSGLQRLVSIKVNNGVYRWDPMVYIVSMTQRQCKPWDSIGAATLCTLIDTNFCKPDDGQTRPKHVADVTSCILTTVICVV